MGIGMGMGGRLVLLLSFYAILSLSSASISAGQKLGSVSGKVIELNESNFDSIISTSDYVFVDFYAPWCGHCQRLSPQLDTAAAILAESKQPVVIAKVDADKFRHLGDKYEINGFPTLMLFTRGVPVDYHGPRKADLIVRFLKKSAAPDVAVLDSDSAIGNFVLSADTYFPAFIGFGMNESAISRVAIKYKQKAWFAVAKDFSDSVMESYDFDKVPAFVSLHLSYDERNVFYGPFDDQFLEEFIKQNLLPLCLPLNSDTMSLLRDEERKIVLTLVEDENNEKSKQLIKLLKAAASANRDFLFAYVGLQQYRGLVESFISNRTELPKMVVWDGNEEYFTVTGSEKIGEEDQGLEITRFLDGYREGKTVSKKISEESFMEFLSSLIGFKLIFFIALLVGILVLVLIILVAYDKDHSRGQPTRLEGGEVYRSRGKED